MAQGTPYNGPPPQPTKSFLGSLVKGLVIGALIGAAVAALLFIHPVAIAVAGWHIAGWHILGHTAAASAAAAHGTAYAGAAHGIAAHAFWPVAGIIAGATTVLAGAGNLISKAVNHHRATKYQHAMEMQQAQAMEMDSLSQARGQAQEYAYTGPNYDKNWSKTVSTLPSTGIDTSTGRSV